MSENKTEKETKFTNCGWVRKSKSGGAITVSINMTEMEKIEGYTSKDGNKYVQLIVNLNRINGVISGASEVTGISHMSSE